MALNAAFVFPGQGSQSVGMLSDLVPLYPSITALFSEASDALGYDLWKLTQNGPIETLNQTEHTQAAMLTADVAVYNILMQQGVEGASVMAGHSLGEYAALVCAGALTLTDAVPLVARRGQLMQQAIPLGQGAMAAIVGLDDVLVKQLCADASDANYQVSPANYNAIGQVVVAGHTPAVNRVIALATEHQARLATLIPVSVPCHCALLRGAAEAFYDYLSAVAFKKPSVDVISNVDLKPYTTVEDFRTKLKEQLYSPVRWVETVQLFAARGVTLLIECGPGKVLSGLTKRIDRNLNALSVYDAKSMDKLLEQLHSTV